MSHSSRRKHPRVSVHLRRIEVQIFKAGDLGTPAAVLGRALANDVSEEGLGIYMKEKMALGPVLIEFGSQPFGRIPGTLIWCQKDQESGTRVLSQEVFSYRAGIRLQFTDEEQRKAYLLFLSPAKAPIMSASSLLLESRAEWIDVAALIGRVFIGICFVVHGLGKLGIVGPGGPKALEGFAGWLRSLGLPFPELQARMAMLAELGGGAMLALGLLTRPVCGILLITMIVAGAIGHKGGGYLITNNPPGNEYTINLGAVLVMIALLGPGPWSLDALIFR